MRRGESRARARGALGIGEGVAALGIRSRLPAARLLKGERMGNIVRKRTAIGQAGRKRIQCTHPNIHDPVGEDQCAHAFRNGTYEG